MAKAARISLNKYIFEMVERGRQEAQLRTDVLQIKTGDIDKDELELAQDMASLLLGIMRRVGAKLLAPVPVDALG